MRILTILGIFFLGSISAFSQTLKEKAESGDEEAQYQYAQKLSDKFFPSEEDLTEAVKWLTKSALQGYAPAQCNLGYHYSQGKGIEQNNEQAVYWYKKAAEQGNATAQYNLGICYANGHGVTRSAYSAYNWYKKSAEQGYVNAEEAFAECYYYGNGTTTNNSLALQWFKKAAEKKNAEAMFYLGECYANGYGTTRNLQTAIEWYNKAADEDDTKGEYALAQLYLTGNGVEKDSIIATELLLHSAAGGFCTPHSMWNSKKGYDKALKKLIELTKINNSQDHHYFLAMLGCYYFSIDDYWNAEKYFKMAIDENSALGIVELGIMYYYIVVNQPHEGELNYPSPYKDKRLGDFMELEGWRHSDNDSVIEYLKTKKWSNVDNVVYWMEKAINYGYGSFTYGPDGFCIYDHILFLLNDSISGYGDDDKAFEIAYKCLTDSMASRYEGALAAISLIGRNSVSEKEIDVLTKLYVYYVKSVGMETYKRKYVLQIINSGLGYCYYKGLGVERNYHIAFRYLSKGAELGGCEAMRLLAACYRYGRGTKVNRIKEKEWVDKAAECGDDKAKKIKERRKR